MVEEFCKSVKDFHPHFISISSVVQAAGSTVCCLPLPAVHFTVYCVLYCLKWERTILNHHLDVLLLFPLLLIFSIFWVHLWWFNFVEILLYQRHRSLLQAFVAFDSVSNRFALAPCCVIAYFCRKIVFFSSFLRPSTRRYRCEGRRGKCRKCL